MNKMIVMIGVAATAAGVFAGPCGGRGCGGGGGCRPRPACRPCRPCDGDWWGKGGRNFWPGFIGGVVGGIVGNAVARPAYSEPVVVQPTTVVTQPVVVQQPVVQTVVSQPARVWVEGRYVDQVQANGMVVRVWQPGHYE